VKKYIIPILILAITASFAIKTTADGEYAWAKTAVDFCSSIGILKGNENGDFMLGENVTQAQTTAFLSRAFETEDGTSLSHNLVEDGHWAAESVKKLSGYIVLPGAFNADASASREMFVSTLCMVIGMYNGSRIALESDFKDAADINPDYVPMLAAAYEVGLLKGSDGRINPKQALTRAEAVTFIYRAMKFTGAVNENYTPVIPEPTVAPQNTYVPEPVIPNQNQTPLLGSSQISVEQAVNWAKSKNAAQIFIDVAPIYWKYGELTGIRPEVLYVQAALETGYGTYKGRVLPEMNNWAGIKKYGATGDATEDHESFATPDDGVRGHFNHMSAYVGVEPVGETHGRYKSVKTLAWAGTVKFVEELSGKWCPLTDYGQKIVNLLNEMPAY